MHVAAPTSHDVEMTTRQAYGTGKPTEAVACRQGNCGTTRPEPSIGAAAAGTHLDDARPHAVQWQLGSYTASSRRRTTATIGHVQTLAGPMHQTRHEPTNTAHRPNTSTSRTNVGLFRPYEQGQTKTETDRSASKEATAPEPASSQSGHAETSDIASSDQSTRRDASAGRGTSAGQDSAVSKAHQPRGAPPPTGAEAEAARRERLNPSLSPKEQRRRDRRVRQEKRLEAMQAAERRPERGLIRDYVDSRWTFSEFLMPVFLIVMAVWLAILIFAPRAIAAVNLLSLAMLVAMLGWIIDSWRLWAGVKKQLNVKYPGVSRKGLLSYLNNRAMTPRRWRNPVPRVERGSHRRA